MDCNLLIVARGLKLELASQQTHWFASNLAHIKSMTVELRAKATHLGEFYIAHATGLIAIQTTRVHRQCLAGCSIYILY